MDTNLERILRDQRDELLTIDYSRFISRSEEKQIELDSHLAQIVIGVRRCGKSTLCQKVLVESKVHFAYVNFDDEELASLRTEELNDVIQVLYRIYFSQITTLINLFPINCNLLNKLLTLAKFISLPPRRKILYGSG